MQDLTKKAYSAIKQHNSKKKEKKLQKWQWQDINWNQDVMKCAPVTAVSHLSMLRVYGVW